MSSAAPPSRATDLSSSALLRDRLEDQATQLAAVLTRVSAARDEVLSESDLHWRGAARAAYSAAREQLVRQLELACHELSLALRDSRRAIESLAGRVG